MEVEKNSILPKGCGWLMSLVHRDAAEKCKRREGKKRERESEMNLRLEGREVYLDFSPRKAEK